MVWVSWGLWGRESTFWCFECRSTTWPHVRDRCRTHREGEFRIWMRRCILEWCSRESCELSLVLLGTLGRGYAVHRWWFPHLSWRNRRSWCSWGRGGRAWCRMDGHSWDSRRACKSQCRIFHGQVFQAASHSQCSSPEVGPECIHGQQVARLLLEVEADVLTFELLIWILVSHYLELFGISSFQPIEDVYKHVSEDIKYFEIVLIEHHFDIETCELA